MSIVMSVNAGSSSLKFQVFVEREDRDLQEWALPIRIRKLLNMKS